MTNSICEITYEYNAIRGVTVMIVTIVCLQQGESHTPMMPMVIQFQRQNQDRQRVMNTIMKTGW